MSTNPARLTDEPNATVPSYLERHYWWAYVHPNAVRVFERQWLVNLILWGNFRRLRDAAIDLLGDPIRGRTLQVACVYGDLTPRLLARHAPALADAGLHRVNISLDTLRHDRFHEITRRGRLDDVWAGIDRARAVGLDPVKLNMVVVKGLNEDEVSDFAQRTLSEGWHVRYIEMMPIGANVSWADNGVVPIPDIRARIEAEVGPLSPIRGPRGNGPARYYQLPGAEGTIGFIGALSEHFCVNCNRLRLTADGKLRPCLMSEHEIDLRTPLRAGVDMGALKNLIKAAIRRKPPRHDLGRTPSPRNRTMAEIGG